MRENALPFRLFGEMGLDACFIVFSLHLKSLWRHLMQCDHSCYMNNYILFCLFMNEDPSKNNIRCHANGDPNKLHSTGLL